MGVIVDFNPLLLCCNGQIPNMPRRMTTAHSEPDSCSFDIVVKTCLERVQNGSDAVMYLDSNSIITLSIIGGPLFPSHKGRTIKGEEGKMYLAH